MTKTEPNVHGMVFAIIKFPIFGHSINTELCNKVLYGLILRKN